MVWRIPYCRQLQKQKGDIDTLTIIRNIILTEKRLLTSYGLLLSLELTDVRRSYGYRLQNLPRATLLWLVIYSLGNCIMNTALGPYYEQTRQRIRQPSNKEETLCWTNCCQMMFPFKEGCRTPKRVLDYHLAAICHARALTSGMFSPFHAVHQYSRQSTKKGEKPQQPVAEGLTQ